MNSSYEDTQTAVLILRHLLGDFTYLRIVLCEYFHNDMVVCNEESDQHVSKWKASATLFVVCIIRSPCFPF